MTHHIDRRSATAPETETRLQADILSQRSEGADAEIRIPLNTVTEVRLSVEMAARANQVVCAVTGSDGDTIRFGSMRCLGPGQWESSVDSFNPLVKALHTALAALPTPVCYREGKPRAYLLGLFGLATLVTGLSLYYFSAIFFGQENTAGLFLLGLTAAGAWMMRLFWPGQARSYDPRLYVDD